MESTCFLSNGQFESNERVSSEELRLIEVLDIRLVEIRDLLVRHNASSSGSSSGSDRGVFCVVKLDRQEIFRSSTVAKTQNPHFGDDFHLEVPKNFTCLSFYVYDQIPNRVARPIGRVSFRKQDLAKYSGLDRWWHLKPLSRHSDVTGKIWLEISRCPSTPLNETSVTTNFLRDGCDECATTTTTQPLAIRILDYCDLNYSRSNDLYAVLSLHYPDGNTETKKLRMRRRPPVSSTDGNAMALRSQDAAVFSIKRPSNVTDVYTESSAPVLRISVWHDILGSFSSYFHGEARVPLDAFLNNPVSSGQELFSAWFSLTPRSHVAATVTTSNNNNSSNYDHNTSAINVMGQSFGCDSSNITSLAPVSSFGGGKESEHLGCLRLKITYTVDHILPVECYNDLWRHLLDALTIKPFRCSVVGVLAALPHTDLERIARPLVKIFLHSEQQLRPLIRILCKEEISQCQDVNTLFRSSSLASKCIYELMKLVGQQYLVSTLKPVVEKVFAERRCCEIDPARLTTGSKIEENRAHLINYAGMALSRILDSSYRCPALLKDVFCILRETTQRYHPNEPAVQWLVLGSFLIMRFFAAALLNPKLFWLRRENPDTTVQRTLALMSKIIQRLCNYVVVGHTLTEKEPFFTPVFECFADETHGRGLIKFFERVSCAGGENSITGESITILKEGILRERIPKRSRKATSLFFDHSLSFPLCFNLRNVFQRSASKPRFCCLSETEFYWHKEKGQSLLGRLPLSEIKVVQLAKDLFNNPLVLEIRSDRSVYLEASNEVELGEWIMCLKRACKRQCLAQQQITENAAQLYEIDIEQQLEAVHMIFLDNFEVLQEWKESMVRADSPSNVANFEGHLANVDAAGRDAFYESLVGTLDCIVALEKKHINHMKHFEQMQYGSKDMPIGDDNYLLLGSRMRDYAIVHAAGECKSFETAVDLENVFVNTGAPPLPPKLSTTVAVLHS